MLCQTCELAQAPSDITKIDEQREETVHCRESQAALGER